MSEPLPYEPRAYTFFCDDVRKELGGKFSIMGVYQDMIGILAPQATLPKLTIFTSIDVPASFAKRKIIINLWQGLENLGGGEIEVPELNDLITSDPRIPKRSRMNVPFELVNIEVKDGMTFQVRAECEGFSYASRKLDVLHNPAVTSMSDVPQAPEVKLA